MMCEDTDRYPTEEDLQRIKEWNAVKNPKGLIDFVCSIWHWGKDFYELSEENGKWLLELHTGGWSGNEEIIGALTKNHFWFFYWQKSERGGHYYFEIPREQGN